MRKITTLVAAAALMAVAMPAGMALANSQTLTAHGTAFRQTPQGSQWALRAHGFQAVTATEICDHTLAHAECSWQFIFQVVSSGMYQDSQIDTAAYRPPTRVKVYLSDRIVMDTGEFAHVKGSVGITFLSAKSARFTFHL